VHVPFHDEHFLLAGNKELESLLNISAVELSQLPHHCAPNHLNLWGKNNKEGIAIYFTTRPKTKAAAS
jgi:hypothetical protein